MKIKAKLTQTVGWNEISGNENVVVDTEIEIDDNVLINSITRKHSIKKKKLWYATLDGKLMVNAKGKSTYMSESKLVQGIYYMLDTVIRSNISYYHNYPRQIRVDVDPNDVIKKLTDEGRLIYHSFEIEQV